MVNYNETLYIVFTTQMEYMLQHIRVRRAEIDITLQSEEGWCGATCNMKGRWEGGEGSVKYHISHRTICRRNA